MRNEFNSKLEEFSNTFSIARKSTDLNSLKDAYSNLETKREEIFYWLMGLECDDEARGEYLSEFAMFEHNQWIDSKTNELVGLMPVFDNSIYFEDIEKMFDEYGSYFQRYGCLRPDQILSWDNQNVLFMDEFSNIEIIKRPDILLNI